MTPHNEAKPPYVVTWRIVCETAEDAEHLRAIIDTMLPILRTPGSPFTSTATEVTNGY